MPSPFPDLLPEIITPPPGPRSLAMASSLAAVESPDITFLSPDFPIFWERALGANVWDADGNRYLDLTSAFGVASVGHSHPSVVEAIQKQSAQLIHGMGDVHPHELKVELATQLSQLAPKGHEWKAIFGLNGSDSIEAAIKTAIVATGKPDVIAFTDAYHGLAFGALGLTAWEKFHHNFEKWIPPQIHRFPFPDRRAASGDDVILEIREFLDAAGSRGASVGSVIIEPILGRGGIRATEPGFLRSLRDLCTERGLLLITDEIYTGCGRTGTWLAAEAESVVPDIIVMGKALGGGMPLSVCLARAEVMDKWGVSRGEARHTSTFLGHPLACAAAIATVEILSRAETMESTRQSGEKFLKHLATALHECNVREIRGRGLMIGLELGGENPGDRAWKTVVAGLKRGLILLPCGRDGNVLSIAPPLHISESQIAFAASTLRDILCGLS